MFRLSGRSGNNLILVFTRLEEEGLMRSLFWLQQSNATVDPTTVLKAAAENVREEALQSFPICTALSPSAKSLKIPVNSTNPKCFNRDVMFDPYSLSI